MRTNLRQLALTYLARREHSSLELYNKLSRKNPDQQQLVKEVIEQLKSENLLSDQRFIEAYINNRMARGYGPLRIQQELHERGIDNELMQTFIDESAYVWFETAAWVRRKKFGKWIPESFPEQAKQMRFLQYRGFSFKQIHSLFSKHNVLSEANS